VRLTMRSSCLFCLLLALAFMFVLPVGNSPVLALEQGQAAPEIDLTDFNGRPVKLSDLRGKVVVVDFWASWCAPCRESFPVFERLSKTYRDQGLVVLGVNVDNDPAAAKKFLADVPVTFTVLADPSKKVAKAYEPKTMPSSYVIDRAGKVRFVHAGFKGSDAQKIEAEIKTLLK
jgi:cytochrome c biogenesis protein CcmG/thiol:disulfide interchange protein DsbE